MWRNIQNIILDSECSEGCYISLDNYQNKIENCLKTCVSYCHRCYFVINCKIINIISEI